MNTMKQKNPQSMGQAWSDDDARGLREIEPMRERGGERDAMILISHKNEPNKAYLPGSKDTVISKAVPSGRDSTIALRWR